MGLGNAARVGLVMCNHNRSRYIGQAIESVLNQTFQDWHLIIWDDASTDASLAVIEKYQDDRITVIKGQVKSFPACQRNALFSLDCPMLGIIDSDDRMLPTCLEETVNFMDMRSDMDLVYTHYYDMTQDGDRLRLGKRCDIAYSREEILRQHMVFHFKLFRKAAHDAIGGIDPFQLLAVDWDFTIRFSREHSIECLEIPLYEYRIHLGSITQSNSIEQNRWARIAIDRARQL
jgi:glycosyltransferase involved in cell wall biosynthesis